MQQVISIIAILLCASVSMGGMSAPRKLVTAGGGGGAAYTDNFNRADEEPITSPWATSTGWDALKVHNNKMFAAVDNHCAAYYNATFSNNQYSQIVSAEHYGGVEHGPMVRISASARTSYYFLRNDDASVQLRKWVAGTYELIGTCSGTPSFTGGAIMRLEANGTSITAKVGGTTICTATDSAVSAGYPGVWISALNKDVDDWAGGDL